MIRTSPIPVPPDNFAYFGATNFDTNLNQQQQKEEHYESLIGRKFDIDRFFIYWSDKSFLNYLTWTVSQGRIPFINVMPFTNKNKNKTATPIAWKDISNGGQDNYIAWLAQTIPNIIKNPYFLCFGPEPEDQERSAIGSEIGPQTNGSAKDYVAAWRRFRQIFDQYGASANTTFIVSLTASKFSDKDQPINYPWFPGVSIVDWIGCSSYNFMQNNATQDLNFQKYWHDLDNYEGALSFYNWALRFGLPLAITEYACKEWQPDPKNVKTLKISKKAQWFQNVKNNFLGKMPKVKALMYWNVSDVTAKYRSRDWLIDSTQQSLTAFKDLAQDAKFNWYTASDLINSHPNSFGDIKKSILKYVFPGETKLEGASMEETKLEETNPEESEMGMFIQDQSSSKFIFCSCLIIILIASVLVISVYFYKKRHSRA